ncbi:MAG: group II intron reverse transcriptase/maturase, partial [Roseburia sp.]|nr:group II intron reverse transcriptase/maturase [Roseburia sp.]
RTRYRILRKLKLEHWQAIKLANCRCGYWRMAEILGTVITNKIIAKLGHTSLLDHYLIVYEN